MDELSASQSDALVMLAGTGQTLVRWHFIWWTCPRVLRFPCRGCGAPGIPAWFTSSGTVGALARRGMIVVVSEDSDSTVYAITPAGTAAASGRPAPVVPCAAAVRLYGHGARSVRLVDADVASAPHKH